LGSFFSVGARNARKIPFAANTGTVKVTDKVVTIPRWRRRVCANSISAPTVQGLPAQYQPYYDQWIVKPENQAMRSFIEDSLAWRSFLFGEGDATNRFLGRHLHRLRRQAQRRSTRVSERIDLLLPTASTQPQTARWRAQVPGTQQPLHLTPGLWSGAGADVPLDARPRNQPNKGELRVGGDFSVLAYIVTQSPGPEADRRRWPVKFGIVPEGIGSAIW